MEEVHFLSFLPWSARGLFPRTRGRCSTRRRACTWRSILSKQNSSCELCPLWVPPASPQGKQSDLKGKENWNDEMQPDNEWQHAAHSLSREQPMGLKYYLIVGRNSSTRINLDFTQNDYLKLQRTGDVTVNEWKMWGVDCPWTLTSFIRQRVIRRWPAAFDGSHPQRPIKIISEGILPAAAAVLEGARRSAVLLIGAIAAVADEVAGLPRSEVVAVIARQELCGTGVCKCQSKPLVIALFRCILAAYT